MNSRRFLLLLLLLLVVVVVVDKRGVLYIKSRWQIGELCQHLHEPEPVRRVKQPDAMHGVARMQQHVLAHRLRLHAAQRQRPVCRAAPVQHQALGAAGRLRDKQRALGARLGPALKVRKDTQT